MSKKDKKDLELDPEKQDEELEEEEEEEESEDESAEDESEEDESEEEEDDADDDESDPEDIDHEEELKALEDGKKPDPEPKASKRSEKDKAVFNFKSISKRVKELGVDPKELLDADEEDEEEDEPSGEDKDFVTKRDLEIRDAEKEASKLAKSESEKRHIMWYVTNRNLSVEDAHLLANKGKIKRTASEIQRRDSARPSKGGGAGERIATKGKAPKLSESELRAVKSANMVWDPKQSAYVGSRIKLRWTGKEWVNERIS